MPSPCPRMYGLDETPAAARERQGMGAAPLPRVGEHTVSVLREMGIADEGAIQAWHDDGILFDASLASRGAKGDLPG